MDNRVLDKLADLIDQLVDLTGWEIVMFEKDDGSGEVDGLVIGSPNMLDSVLGGEPTEEELALEQRADNAILH